MVVNSGAAVLLFGMNEIENLKSRAALWSQKADRVLSSAKAKAELKAGQLQAKADMLFEQESTKGANKADKWLEKGRPDRAEMATVLGNSLAFAKAQRWQARAEQLLAREKETAELQAQLLRERAAELLACAADLEAQADDQRIANQIIKELGDENKEI